MGDLQPWPSLLDGAHAIGDGGGGGDGTDDGIDIVDIVDGGSGGGGGGSPVALEESQPLALQTQQPPNPPPSAIADENWQQAEEATREVLRCIQPTVASEQRRKAVVEYVQNLLRLRIGIEVYPFGSVPLKTYLPDGDIDLTAVGVLNTEDTLANDVYSVLEAEEHNKDSEFNVKDVQFIHAEVKLVKCIVQNIVVDISFNQIGGLCTLCFLEKADQIIGNENLFKRSVILIKAWCYYESRILGAHHGLISTYALETLVLYIFHLFHKSLNDPLAVLYRFLDFYSKFDWDNYCVSLYGPVLVSSLPDLIVEPPETDESDLLFSKEFIKECADMFSVPSRGLDSPSRIFPQKHLNIVDPLKQNNNLGRSVSKGNFYRIRSAFTYGARKLGRILLFPVESILDEINLFFTNTLDRHGTRERPDVQDGPPSCSDNRTTNHSRANSVSSHLKVENGYKEKSISDLAINDFNGTSTEETNEVSLPDIDKDHETRLQVNTISHNCFLDVPNGLKLEPNRLTRMQIVSNACISGDARDLDSTPRIMGETVTSSGNGFHAFQAESGSEDENIDNMNSRYDTLKNAAINGTGAAVDEPSYETVSSSSTSWFGNDTDFPPTNNIYLSPSPSCMSEDSNPADISNDAKENIKNARSQNLADLSGNHQFHFMNLICAQNSQEVTLNPYFISIHPSSPSHYQSKHPWNSFHQRNMYTHTGTNGLLPGTSFPPSYLFNQPMVAAAYSTKDIQTTRGTGTYFPNTNSRSYRERQQTIRGKNQIHANNIPRSRHYYGRSETLQDRGLPNEGNDEPSPRPQASSFGGSGRSKPSPLEFSNSRCSPSKVVSHGVSSTDGKLEFGTLGAMAIGVSSREPGGISEQGGFISQDSRSRIMPSMLQKPSSNHERPAQPYQHKDEDFPPLKS